MFRTEQDRQKEKKQKAMQNVSIDKEAFTLDDYAEIENFYDMQVQNNQTSNMEANHYIDNLDKSSQEDSQANASNRHNYGSNLSNKVSNINMMRSSYNDVVNNNHHDHLTKMVNKDLSTKLQDFEVKHEKKKKNQIAEDNKFELDKEKLKKKNKDLFEWLFIPSKFTILRKMVRMKQVEMIRDQCRFNKIEGAMQDYEMSKFDNEESQIYDFRIDIMLNNEIKVMLEREKQEIIDSDPIKGYHKYEKLHKDNREKHYKNLHLNDSEEHLNSEKVSDMKYSLKRSIINDSSGALNDDITQNNQPNFKPQSQRVNALDQNKNVHNKQKSKDNRHSARDNRQENPSKYVWNKNKEQLYQSNKGRSKDWLQHSVPNKSVSFEDCGFSHFIQEILNNGQVKNLREKLLEKYIDGNWLTYKEIKYLDLTSEYLNMFLDKNIFKFAVQLLERECIDGIEMMIGNEIIDEYNLLKKNIKDSRLNYLSKKNEKDRKRQFSGVKPTSADNTKYNKGKLNLERKMLKLNKAEIFKIFNSRIETLNHEEKTKFNKDTVKERTSEEGFQRNSHQERSFIRKSNDSFGIDKAKNVSFKDIAKKNEKDREQSHEIKNPIIDEFLSRNYSVPKEISTNFNGVLNERRIQHLKHPTSKQIRKEEPLGAFSYQGKRHSSRPQSSVVNRKNKRLDTSSSELDYYNNESKRYRSLDPEEQKYRLKINDDSQLKDKKAFHGAHSGGPLWRLQNVRYRTKKSNVERGRAAIVIQKMWRGYRARKKVGFNRKLFRTKFAISGGVVDFRGIKLKKTTESLNREILRKKKQRIRSARFDDLNLTTNHPYNSEILNTYEFATKKNKPFNVMSNLNKSLVDHGTFDATNKRGKVNIQNSSFAYQKDLSKSSAISPLTTLKNNTLKKNNYLFNNSFMSKNSEGQESASIPKLFNKSYLDKLSTPVKNREREEKREEFFNWCINGEFSKIRNCVWTILKADIKSQDKKGNTPLYYACQNENYDIIKFQINRGADLNAPNENGNTCMHLAFILRKPELLKWQIDNKGDSDIVNNQNMKPGYYGDEFQAEEIKIYEYEKNHMMSTKYGSVDYNNSRLNNHTSSTISAHKESQALLNHSIEQKRNRNYQKPWLLDSYNEKTLRSDSLKNDTDAANNRKESRRRAEQRKKAAQMEEKRLYFPAYIPDKHIE